MEIPLASYLLKSIALSFSLLIFISNLLKFELKFEKFSKFFLATTLPAVYLLFGSNLAIYAVSHAILMVLALKFILNVQYKNLIIPTLIGYTFYQLVLNIYTTLIDGIGILKLIISNPVYFAALFTLSIPATVIVLSYIMKKYIEPYLFADNLRMLDNRQYTFISGFLVLLISLLSYLNPYFSVVSGGSYSGKIGSLLNIFFIINMALLYSSLKNVFDKQLVEIKNQALIENTKDLHELNKELRSQKHDFYNHLQVISGMLQLKKYNECFNYVVGIHNSDLSRPSLRTGLISINALLNSKQLRAKHKDVNLRLDIATELDSSKFKVNDWEITKVLGNLIDNAIFEETKVSTKDKYVEVKIGEDDLHYSFTVFNRNSFIGLDKRNKIFSSGFSTKGKDGHGMGLYIVKNVVDKYKGKIHLESHIGSGTKFSLFFPKNAELHENQFSETKSYPPQESLNTQIN